MKKSILALFYLSLGAKLKLKLIVSFYLAPSFWLHKRLNNEKSAHELTLGKVYDNELGILTAIAMPRTLLQTSVNWGKHM